MIFFQIWEINQSHKIKRVNIIKEKIALASSEIEEKEASTFDDYGFHSNRRWDCDERIKQQRLQQVEVEASTLWLTIISPRLNGRCAMISSRRIRAFCRGRQRSPHAPNQQIVQIICS